MKLFQYCGINVKMDKFFVLMMVFYGFAGVLPQAAVLFSVVLVHEMSHIFTARLFKVNIDEVILFPFGGVAKLDYIDVDSNEEIYIALMGPLTNFFLVGIAMAAQYYINSNYWLPFFIRLNLVMGVFNLIPVLPLDGGRIFRAMYARIKGVWTATKVAAKQGKLIALLLLFTSVSGLYLKICDLNAVTMAAFLFYSSGKQDKTASFYFIRYLINKKEIIAKENIQNIKTYYIRNDTKLREIFPYFIPNNYHLFYVFDKNGNLTNTLSEEKIIETYFKKGDNIAIGEV